MTGEYKTKTDEQKVEIAQILVDQKTIFYDKINVITQAGELKRSNLIKGVVRPGRDKEIEAIIGVALYADAILDQREQKDSKPRELYIQHQKDGTVRGFDFLVNSSGEKTIKEFTLKLDGNGSLEPNVTIKTCTTASLQGDQAQKYEVDKEGLGVALEKDLVTNIIYRNIKEDINNKANLGNTQKRIETSLGKERYDALSDETKEYVTKLSVEVEKIAKISDKKGMLNTLKRWWDQRKFSKLVNNKQQKNHILDALKQVSKTKITTGAQNHQGKEREQSQRLQI